MKNSVNLAELNAAGGRLSIFVNAEQEPIGILIPLAGWANIAPAVPMIVNYICLCPS